MIGDSIDSILAQEYPDFELIVVDDSSTDATASVISAYTDRRIRVLHTPQRLGIARARNHAFAAARGRYLALTDHDDLSHPERLERQVRHLDAHPGVAAVGTDVMLARRGRLQATDNPEFIPGHLMRWMLLIDNPLTYSSMMLRADSVRALETFMRREYEPSDDFDLYHRLLARGDIVRLGEVLATYRWHAANASHEQGQLLFGNAVRVLARTYRDWLGEEAETAAALVVRHLSERVPAPDGPSLRRLGGYIRWLLAAFLAAHPLDPVARASIEQHAGRVWWRATRAAIRTGRPWLAGSLWAEPILTRCHPVPLVDGAVSLAVGSLRAPGALWRRSLDGNAGPAPTQRGKAPIH